jgi:hypothetical protein
VSCAAAAAGRVLASPDVIVLALAACGALSLVLGALVMRGFGSGYRVGRILRAAPEVTLEEAAEAAREGRRAYVRVHGRISSDEEFPDEHDRPLVYRRRRVQLGARSGWEAIEDRRLAVPFGVAGRGARIGVDLAALDEGLVVMPRESRGVASEVPDQVPPGTQPDRPVRLLIEQVSAVEHAYVAGVPALDTDGRPVLTAGAGRPLVVCTLDLPDAMRVLGGADRTRAARAAFLLGAGCLLLAVALLALVAAPALAASPSPVDIGAGDTRTSGTPPSFVGQPILALIGVVVLGVLTAAATALYVRVTRRS